MSTNGGQAWKALIGLLQSAKPWMAERFGAFDLTPQLAYALHVLSDAREVKMSEFSLLMACDASNATGLVDRLEARGLVERRAATDDRRAKVVRLTAAGARLERRVSEHVFREAPPPIARLSAADQRRLREILTRALANAENGREDSA